jgi:orotate phosphoribosyltransferase-like protein
MKDKRLKVTQTIIDKMRRLRQEGLSYAEVANSIGNISWSTAYYWCNEDQRLKQIAKNSKRKHTPEENARRIPKDIARRKRRWKENPKTKLAHEIRSALNDKRCARHSVRGIPIEEAKALLESGTLSAPRTQVK